MKYFKIGWILFALMSLISTGIQAQEVTEINISSIVYDEKGSPVDGAIVSGNQGKIVAYTDKTGKFSIKVPINSDLVISAKGFRSSVIKATATLGNISLSSEESLYSEVYLPFNKTNKRDVAGAISILNPESYIDQDFNLTVQGGMNGRVAGLLWSNNIWGLENAIVVIDGIRREFSDITFNEVQQISVLKGVNAVALYGSQAAKGIIFITTKKGEVDGRKIGIRVNTGLATPSEMPRYLQSSNYMTLFNEARRNDGLPNLYDAATIQNHASASNIYRYPNANYYSAKYLKQFQNATDANAEFSGGNKNARFYSNIGFANSSTLLNVGEGRNENDNRLNVRGNVDLKLNEHISSSVYVSAIFSESRRARGNFWANAATLLPNRLEPLIPISLIPESNKALLALAASSRNIIDGKYLLAGAQQFQTNPIADLYASGYDMNIRRVLQVTNQIDASLSTVVKGLSFHTLFNLDYSNSYLQSISNTYAVFAPTWSSNSNTLTGLQKFGEDARPGIQNINNTTQRQNIGFSSWFSYDKVVANDHNVSAKLLGFTSSVTVNDVYQPITNSHLGLQLGYNYKHKYFVDFSSAYVNSTKLPKGNRASFSPTVNLTWLASAENFLANLKSVNHLKLSASAGILNTDLDISNYYLYEDIYNRGAFFTWNDGVQAQTQATTSANGANPNLGFPTRREVNATIEAGFFNNLITMQSSFFITEMDGLLTQRFSQYPNYFSSFIPYTNYNANKRSGFDLMLNFNKKIGDVQFSVGTNLVYSKSTVTKRDELFLDAYQNRAGKPLDAIFGLQNAGFFKDQADINNSPRQLFSEVRPGDIKYVDQNGDNVIDNRDEVMIGRYIAPFTYGITFSVAYKNLNLFVLGTGNNGGYGLTNNNYYWVSGDLKYSEVVLNRWTEATKNTATYPRLSSQQNNNNFRSSDFWVYKTDRFNLSRVQLTYNLSNVFRNSVFKGMLVYISGSNLYTFAQNRKILELAVASSPQLRSYNMGIRAQF